MANKIDKNKIIQAVIKNSKDITKIVVLSLVVSAVVGVAGCVGNEIIEKNNTKVEQSYKDEDLDFYVIENFDGKDYLSLREGDLLRLIETAINEVDEEYLQNGCTPVFDVKDKEFSLFDKYDILGIFQQESSFRLLELKDGKKGIFNISNYAKFQGVDSEGVKYNGPGMMSAQAVRYVVENDRQQTNGFTNFDKFTINDKEVEISFDNLNPYDYVIRSGAKTQEEIESALSECIILNAKSVYITLNRFVKDYVKAGTHDTELDILNSYKQFKNLSVEERQKAFALICYNNGGSISYSSMVNGKLFEKNEQGDYIINVGYAKLVFQNSENARANFENNLVADWFE